MNTLNELKETLLKKNGDKAGIYRITRKSDNKVYIGQTSKKIVDRLLEHINNTNATSGIDLAIQQEGWKQFEYEVLTYVSDPDTELLWELEHQEINRADKEGYALFNLTKGNHVNRATYRKAMHIVGLEMLKPIKKDMMINWKNSNVLLIHNYDKIVKDIISSNDNTTITIITDTDHTIKYNNKGEIKEDEEVLGNYIKGELNNMKESNNVNYENIISNPPYGDIGAEITLQALNNLKFNTYINLEPGNDYFTSVKLYRHIDTSFKPVVLRKGCFKDAAQTTVIVKLQKEENNLSEIEARILLHLTTDGDERWYEALREYLLKVNLKTPIEFSSCTKDNGISTRRNTLIKYDENLFLFNSGAYDIINGNYAVVSKDKSSFTNGINYNIFHKDVSAGSDFPSSYIRGCKGFKKMFFSKPGFAFSRILFNSLPEGWGYTGAFANIDYTNIDSIQKYFNEISLSCESQNIILSKMSEIKLTDKELEICKIVEEM